MIHSAVNENPQGALQSFLIGEQGALTGPLDTISSGGDSPAFTTALSTGQVAIMNVRPRVYRRTKADSAITVQLW